MPTELLLTNIGFAVSIAMALSLGILVFIKRPATGGAVNVVFFLTSVLESIWAASYVIGVNISDPELSRLAFMFNLSTLFLIISNIQLVLVLAGRFAPKKKSFIVLYGIAALLVIFYALFPDTFLLPSKPAAYFANFFVPGSLYEVQDTYFFILSVYFMYETFMSYRRSAFIIQQRLRFFIIGQVYAYIISLFPEFLVYGIAVDPILASIVGLNTIPLAYAILKYELVNLNILAKKSIIVSTGLRKRQVITSVQDFGIGISAEDLPRIFQKFFRSSSALLAHTEDLGIGLFLAKDIMRRQGGDIWAESTGQVTGSTFFISLPLKK